MHAKPKKPKFNLSLFRRLVFLNFFLSASTAFGATLTLQSLDLPKTFPIKSEFYTVSPTVQESSEAGFLKFTVTASHATYQEEGLAPLAKLLKEVEVIERIKTKKEGSGFVDGAADSVATTGKGLVNIVAHPVNSAKGLGSAAGSIGRGIGGVFKKKEEGEKTSFGDKLMGSAERELANQYGVDVYTRNPYMQEVLRRMAKARMGGKGAVFVVQLLIPVGLVASVALTAGSINGNADKIINDKSRTELFRLNQEALVQMGFGPDDVNSFLNNSHFSPRESTYVRFYLETLQNVRGFRDIFKKAKDAKSIWDARKIIYVAQIAADSAQKTKYKNIKVYKEGLALDEDTKAILITPYDYLDKASLGESVLDRVGDIKKNWGKNSVEIWNAGKVTLGFSSAAFLKGAKTQDWALFKA